MEQNSPQGDRKPRSGSSGNRNRNRNRNRSGGNRQGGNRSGGNRNQQGGRRRRREPKLTGFQKFLKAITFGIVDPAKKKRKGRKPAAKNDRRRIIEDPTTGRLYIGNLSYDLTDEELEATFTPIGKVVSASVVRHGDSGRSKGFGFVEMGSVEEARAAVSKLNDTDLKGRKLLVSGAKAEKPRKSEGRPPREGGRGERGERRSREGGERPPRRDGRSRDRGERGRRRSDDRVEKPARQVQPPKIEVVTGPKLLVKNLNKDATEIDIADLFDGIGEIREKSEVIVEGESTTGELTVEFSEVEAAQRAVEVIDMKFFMGHQLRLKGIEGDAPAESTEKPAEETPAPAEEAPPEPAPAEEVVAEEAPAEEAAPAESVAAEGSSEPSVEESSEASPEETPEEEKPKED
ncbi:MAG: hypothetical protein AAF733_07540 [Verrucomicrobiota bacterium]